MSEYVATLTLESEQGGKDFKNLIAHVIEKKCAVEDVHFEIWKNCRPT